MFSSGVSQLLIGGLDPHLDPRIEQIGPQIDVLSMRDIAAAAASRLRANAAGRCAPEAPIASPD